MEKKKFSETMGMLQSYFDYKIEKKEVLRIYWEKLKEIPDGLWDKSVNNVLENFTPTSTNPFPLIKDFLQMGGRDPHTKAVNAVSLVRKAIFSPGLYESVDFGDPILHGVISRYGGWIEICNWTAEDWNFKESGFIRAYESAAFDPHIDAPKYLAGIHEKNNGARIPVYLGPPEKQFLIPKKETVKKELGGGEFLSGLASKIVKKV